MHSISDFNHVCLSIRKSNKDTNEKINDVLIWAQFYANAHAACTYLLRAHDYETNHEQHKVNLQNAGSCACGVIGYFSLFPKDWQNVQLHFHIPGKAPYVLTYAQLEMKMYELKAKYFEYNADLGKYRDPCTRHFPCNRILRNNTPTQKETP